MSKASKGIAYSKASPAIVKLVKEIVADAQKHSYSVSKVYAAYNAVFEVNERPQTCSSCLRNRAKLLTEWLKGYKAPVSGDEYVMEDGSTITINKAGKALRDGKGVAAGKYITAEGNLVVVSPGSKARHEIIEPTYAPQAEGTVRYPMAEGAPFDFLPKEGTLVQGTVVRADGTQIEPGVYITAEGLNIEVQEDGVANIKEEDLT